MYLQWHASDHTLFSTQIFYLVFDKEVCRIVISGTYDLLTVSMLGNSSFPVESNSTDFSANSGSIKTTVCIVRYTVVASVGFMLCRGSHGIE